MPPVRHLPDLRLLSSRPILYADAALAASLGLPPHVRSASSVALAGDLLYAVQDDVHAVARIDPRTALAEPIPLPLEGPLVRLKASKVDLEACATLPDGRLLLFGSGSAAGRDVALTFTPATGAAEVLPSGPFYAWLAKELRQVGAGMNIEGVTLAGDVVHVLHRGAGRTDPSAIVRLRTDAFLAALAGGPMPERAVTRAVELGDLDGVPLSFTDGVEVYGLGIVFTATAEDTTNAIDDGAVAGSVVGLLDRQGRVSVARILDVNGAPLRSKVEGIALAGDRAWMVVDADDTDKPSDLLEIPFGGLGAPTPGEVPIDPASPPAEPALTPQVDAPSHRPQPL